MNINYYQQTILKLTLILTTFLVSDANADTTLVAVASNFSKPMEEIAVGFKQSTGHEALLSFGASGKFVSQISNGAPFDILLSADEKGPQQLEDLGLTVKGSRFTYAMGSLVLWSPKENFIDNAVGILHSDAFSHLAIADPTVAPYGAAAMSFLKERGLLEKVQGKLVYGENISQTFLFVSSGNAELGFVSLSQVIDKGKIGRGSGWILPRGSYPPIRQDAALMRSGEKNPAARALLEFLRSKEAVSIIKSYGYELAN